MNRWVQLGAVLLLGAVAGLCNDQKPAAKEPPPPPPPPVKKNAAKGGVPKIQERLVNPANPATRLFRMTPEQRERAIEQMKPAQQVTARKQVEWFDSLPKDQQAIQLKRIEHFEQLPPEQRAEVRGLLVEAQSLPAPRKALVRGALARLQTMSDADRDRFLGSPQFKERFTPEEQRLITRLADAWLPPF